VCRSTKDLCDILVFRKPPNGHLTEKSLRMVSVGVKTEFGVANLFSSFEVKAMIVEYS
jgi:hypothetical protein